MVVSSQPQTKRAGARLPQRRPGQVRFDKLLKALDDLLAENSVQDVGLYQIAEKAGVPSASVYHFFPNKEAALLALAKVHHEALKRISMQGLSRAPTHWQEMMRAKITEAANYHNENPAALRLFMGANISAEVKIEDVSQYLRLAEGRSALLETYFHVPLIPDWHRRLASYFSIVDGVFSLSYAQHNMITEEYLEEARRAAIAYLRCYLPEYLTPKRP